MQLTTSLVTFQGVDVYRNNLLSLPFCSVPFYSLPTPTQTPSLGAAIGFGRALYALLALTGRQARFCPL